MTDSDPPQAPPLALPPAVLFSSFPASHPDSEGFIQYERQRVARELEPVHAHDFAPSSTSGSHGNASPQMPQGPRSPTLRSRGFRASPHFGGIRRRPSEVSTAPDTLGPEENDERRYRLKRQSPHWYDPIVKFWRTQISVTIDEGVHRDHLALERTFLGYLRTSLALAMTGVIIAQLFRLQHSVNPSPDFGFFVLGIPLAAAFMGAGMLVLLIGAFRFWRQQNAMIRGKCYAGGWEITGIMVLGILLCIAAFVMVTAVSVERSFA